MASSILIAVVFLFMQHYALANHHMELMAIPWPFPADYKPTVDMYPKGSMIELTVKYAWTDSANLPVFVWTRSIDHTGSEPFVPIAGVNSWPITTVTPMVWKDGFVMQTATISEWNDRDSICVKINNADGTIIAGISWKLMYPVCPEFATMLHGHWEYSSPWRFEGSWATFFCNEGFYLSGATKATCLSTGLWDNPMPTCLYVCPNILPLPNGGFNYSSEFHEQGSWVDFWCEEGYKMVGSPKVFCSATGTWDGNTFPFCAKVHAAALVLEPTTSPIYMKSGTEMILTARLSGVPLPALEWYHNGKLMNMELFDKFESFDRNSWPWHMVFTLKIKKFSANDTFEVRAMDEFGKVLFTEKRTIFMIDAKSWVYAGCYKLDSNFAPSWYEEVSLANNPLFTNFMCQQACFAKNYTVAATNSNRCFCCNDQKWNISWKVEESFCSWPCPGNSKHMCGGDKFYYSFYFYQVPLLYVNASVFNHPIYNPNYPNYLLDWCDEYDTFPPFQCKKVAAHNFCQQQGYLWASEWTRTLCQFPTTTWTKHTACYPYSFFLAGCWRYEAITCGYNLPSATWETDYTHWKTEKTKNWQRTFWSF